MIGICALTTTLPDNALHEGAEAGLRGFFCRSFLIHPVASCTRARATKEPGSTSGDARRRIDVDAGGERRIVFEDAYVVLRVPITA